MRRVTIKDIAKIAGVSYATVSRALSGSPEISEETRIRIVEICRREGYRANTLARSLICNKTNVIGLIIPEVTNPYYAEIAFGIERSARERGYNVMLCNSGYEDAHVDELFDFLVGHQVDGIILANSRNEACDWASRYLRTIPTVLLGDAVTGGTSEPDRLGTVSIDNRAGGRMGAEYLQRLGHTDILYAGVRPNSITHQLRAQGYRDAMEHARLCAKIAENPGGSSSIEHGYELGKQLFTRKRDYTAIFAATDTLALGLMQAAEECGVSIPGELSLLGFDNISYSALPRITLSTIDQRKALLADTAVRILLDTIAQPEQQQYHKCLVPPTLIERHSCRAR